MNSTYGENTSCISKIGYNSTSVIAQAADISYPVCLSVSLLACMATLIAYCKTTCTRSELTSRKTFWGSMLTWIFANFIVSFILRDLMLLGVFIIPNVTNTTLYLIVFIYISLPNYFWMFTEVLFLYLSACHYNGLYNKVMGLYLPYKKITIFMFCWLTPVVLITIWATQKMVICGVIIFIPDKTDWVCIVGPFYIILAMNFIMMVRILYSQGCTNLKEVQYKRKFKSNSRPSTEYDDSGPSREYDSSRPSREYDDSGPSGEYDSSRPSMQGERLLDTDCRVHGARGMHEPPTQNNNSHVTKQPASDGCEQNECITVPIEVCDKIAKMMSFLIILSALYGFTNLIAIVIHRTENNRQVNEIVALVNSILNFLHGFFVALIFARSNKEIMHFAKLAMSRKESRRRRSENDLRNDLRRKSSNIGASSSVSSSKRSSSSASSGYVSLPFGARSNVGSFDSSADDFNQSRHDLDTAV